MKLKTLICITLVTIISLSNCEDKRSIMACDENCQKCNQTSCEICKEGFYQLTALGQCLSKKDNCKYYDMEKQECMVCQPGYLIQKSEINENENHYCEVLERSKNFIYMLIMFIVVVIGSILTCVYISIKAGAINFSRFKMKGRKLSVEDKVSGREDPQNKITQSNVKNNPNSEANEFQRASMMKSNNGLNNPSGSKIEKMVNSVIKKRENMDQAGNSYGRINNPNDNNLDDDNDSLSLDIKEVANKQKNENIKKLRFKDD